MPLLAPPTMQAQQGGMSPEDLMKIMALAKAGQAAPEAAPITPMQTPPPMPMGTPTGGGADGTNLMGSAPPSTPFEGSQFAGMNQPQGLLDMAAPQAPAMGGTLGAATSPQPDGTGAVGPVPTGAPVGANATPSLMDRTLKNPDFVMALATGLNGMRTSPDAGINQMFQQYGTQRAKTKEDERKLALISARANQTASWFDAQGHKEWGDAVRANPEGALDLLSEYQKQTLKEPKESYSIKKGSELGLTGASANMDFNVSSSGKLSPVVRPPLVKLGDTYGPIPAGYERYKTPEGTEQMRPIPGSPAARKEAQENATMDAAAQNRQGIDYRITSTVSKVREGLSNPSISTGSATPDAVGRLITSAVPGTPEYGLSQDLDTLKANISFDELAKMRAASKTGGAVGALSDDERRALGSLRGALDLGIETGKLDQTLVDIDKQSFLGTNGTPERVREAFMTGKSASGTPLTPEDYDEYLKAYSERFGNLPAPIPGERRFGYTYRGGNPAEETSWQ